MPNLLGPWNVQFPVRFYANGDTVHEGFHKHIQELERIYGLLNALDSNKLDSTDLSNALTTSLTAHINNSNPHPNLLLDNTKGTLDGTRLRNKIDAALVNGDLTNSKIAAAKVYDTINGTVKDGQWQASRIYGDLANATINAGKCNGDLTNAKIDAGRVYDTINGTKQDGQIKASRIYGDLTNATINASLVNGDLTNAKIDIDKVYDTINGTKYDGRIKASRIYGALVNATIPAGNVTNLQQQIIKTDSLNNTGYVELANGLIFQWGHTDKYSHKDEILKTMTFLKPFTNQCFVVLATLHAHSIINFAHMDKGLCINGDTITNSGFEISLQETTGDTEGAVYSADWLAIGI